MVQKAAFWGDIHIPFDDPEAEGVLVDWLRWFKPDLACILGDLIDFYAISSFDTDPTRRLDVPDDIAAANDYLDRMDKCLREIRVRRKVFIEGNHEDRLRRYLWRRAPELAHLEGLSIPDLFSLEARGWEFIPYYDPVNRAGAPGFIYYNLLIVHGRLARKWSAYSARANFEQFNYSGISGHTHRLGAYYHRAYGGQYVWYEAGCMCRLEPVYRTSPDWQQGLLGVYVHTDNGDPSPRFEIIPGFIWHGRMSWCGKLFGRREEQK